MRKYFAFAQQPAQPKGRGSRELDLHDVFHVRLVFQNIIPLLREKIQSVCGTSPQITVKCDAEPFISRTEQCFPFICDDRRGRKFIHAEHVADLFADLGILFFRHAAAALKKERKVFPCTAGTALVYDTHELLFDFGEQDILIRLLSVASDTELFFENRMGQRMADQFMRRCIVINAGYGVQAESVGLHIGLQIFPKKGILIFREQIFLFQPFKTGLNIHFIPPFALSSAKTIMTQFVCRIYSNNVNNR